jgi:hypothetical protein
MEQLAAALPKSKRAALARLEATLLLRVACAVEVGFDAGVAAGRAR